MSSRERTPDQQSAETASAVAESPAAEVKADGPSFADKVGKREWEPKTLFRGADQ
jgi:hypothetical protein